MKTFKRIKMAWKYIFDDDWRMARINDDGSLIFDFIHSDGNNFKILYLNRQTDSMRRLNNLGTK